MKFDRQTDTDGHIDRHTDRQNKQTDKRQTDDQTLIFCFIAKDMGLPVCNIAAR